MKNNSEKSFLVSYEKPELRVAELRLGKLYDLDIERSQGELGSIFCGRITNIIVGMDAVFVDIGARRNGLLHLDDIYWLPSAGRFIDPKSKISASELKLGQYLLVQVARPSTGEKGPRLTTRISLPGRYVVLVFPSESVGVSRKIESQSERNRLKSIVEKLRPLDYGVIVRTEAEGATVMQLERDLNTLLRRMETIKTNISKSLQNTAAPNCLHQDLGVLGKVIRDRLSSDTFEVLLDDVSQYEACQSLVSDFAPDLFERIKLYKDRKPIFQAFEVDKDLKQALQSTVPLRHGGSLVIDETEALTVIDVNTARFTGKDRLAETVLQTNLEAVDEATLQMRLRNLGGIILIDFIDMVRTRDRIQVLNSLESAVKKDRVKTQIVQLSPSGLVEITRRREGLSLSQLMFAPCSNCHGTGKTKLPETVAIEIRQRLRSLASDQKRTLFVTTHPSVAMALIGGQMQYIEELEQDCSALFIIRVDEGLHTESFQIDLAPQSFSLVNEPVNQRHTLGPHDFLYPIDKPEFAVWKNHLIKLPQGMPLAEGASHLAEIVVMEIFELGRWYGNAHIIGNADPMSG